MNITANEVREVAKNGFGKRVWNFPLLFVTKIGQRHDCIITVLCCRV